MFRRLPTHTRLVSSFARRGRRNEIGGISAGGPRARGRMVPPPTCATPRRCFSRPAQATSVDIARFALLSAFSLPFTVWITAFTYDYMYRVEICQDALARHDKGLLGEPNSSGEFLGREKELAETISLLDQEPFQIIVLAGKNEAGKSRFIRELLRGAEYHAADRGVTLLQLAHVVDSVSTFTHVFVDAFDLRWLQLRHALVDVLPFAGSEILVMKERFSDRDLRACLMVITDALKRNAKEHPDKPRPVIVVDGMGEFSRRYTDSKERELLSELLLQWSIYVTKEHRLAHIVLTGNEQLVMSLTDQNRVTRGHVRVVGLGDLGLEDAAKIVRSELPDATDEEIECITNVFGGFIHDVKGTSRDIQHRIARKGKKVCKVGSKKRMKVINEVIKMRFQQQIERVVTAFADARKNNDSNDKEGDASPKDTDDINPYLDPLKSIYSEAQASQGSNCGQRDARATWTQLQLWRTLQRLVKSPNMAVSFSDLRDDVFDGNKEPILDLMEEDILSFEVRSSDNGWFWEVTPASPALGLAFARLVKKHSFLGLFEQIEKAEERSTEKKSLEMERARLCRERRDLDLRKKSLLQTIELGKEIGQENVASQRLSLAFQDIVQKEEMHDMEDRTVREKLSLLMANDNVNAGYPPKRAEANVSTAHQEDSLPLHALLKSSVLDILSSE
mmetsp:Transcript_52624/g.111767  ORF Transcript_52624/g.111767 Transcript_52624/m.111767 type:complete len:676 (+) Transcript_52624:308-2335(+)